jgi:hypothetical protein
VALVNFLTVVKDYLMSKKQRSKSHDEKHFEDVKPAASSASVTSYQPNLVTKTTGSDGVITITFIHKQPFTNDTQASHHVEGFGVFVRELHDTGYKAQAHLESTVDRSGFYHYTQSFEKK